MSKSFKYYVKARSLGSAKNKVFLERSTSFWKKRRIKNMKRVDRDKKFKYGLKMYEYELIKR